MSELLSSTNPVTVEESGYQKLGVVEHGVEKEILVKTGDLPVGGGEGGATPPAVDLTPYAKSADVAATYAKKTDVTGLAKSADVESTYAKKTDLNGVAKTADLTGAAAATAADGLKLLLVDGSTVKQITLANLKAYLATT